MRPSGTGVGAGTGAGMAISANVAFLAIQAGVRLYAGLRAANVARVRDAPLILPLPGAPGTSVDTIVEWFQDPDTRRLRPR